MYEYGSMEASNGLLHLLKCRNLLPRFTNSVKPPRNTSLMSFNPISWSPLEEEDMFQPEYSGNLDLLHNLPHLSVKTQYLLQHTAPSSNAPFRLISPSRPSACPFTNPCPPAATHPSRLKHQEQKSHVPNGSTCLRSRFQVLLARIYWLSMRWTTRGQHWSMRWRSCRRMLRLRGEICPGEAVTRGFVFSCCMWVFVQPASLVPYSSTFSHLSNFSHPLHSSS